MIARPQLTVRWVDRSHATISVGDGAEFNAVCESGWRTVGHPATDDWSFNDLEDLLAFIQERAQ